MPGSWLLAGTCHLTSGVLQAGCSTCGSWTWATVGLSTVDLAGAASRGLSFRERSVAFHGLLFQPSCVIFRARGTRKTQAPQNVRAAAAEPSAKPGPLRPGLCTGHAAGHQLHRCALCALQPRSRLSLRARETAPRQKSIPHWAPLVSGSPDNTLSGPVSRRHTAEDLLKRRGLHL